MSEPRLKTALITGAAHRIGRTMALALAKEGWSVAVHFHRSHEAAFSLVDDIVAAGGRGVAVQADLANEDDVLGLIPDAVDALGPLGLLVNNASLFEQDSALTVTRASWDAHLETNLRAPFVLIQSFAAQLPEDMDGVVVNMLDQRVWNLSPHFTTYTLSKAALWTLTQTLALALAPRIRVNAIGPGPTLPSPRQTAEQFDRQCAEMPLKRGTTPEEIAGALRFILSAPAMTGQLIALDGGQHLCWAPSSKPPEE
ncbi:SDR family oxidoreductase [Telmatospirillum sp.]|uniref:SDR family oxidoreductase n=1 Tax=Telmatospirillum sp. TaxID=2079197 RepID=UPI0028516703|nr:SDR family oxidoreductase [Telmatospirillum sp.]MDR3438462.1 SDR family oxidoreductase [Telmatospirillum sp.]